MAETETLAKPMSDAGKSYSGLEDFIANGTRALAKGPIALVFCEDEVELDTTLRHHQQLGFKSVVGFMPDGFGLPGDLVKTVHRVRYDMTVEGALQTAVDAVSRAAAGEWLYYCYNAEYLFYPFCETRTVGEMLAFHTEERRDAMLTYVIDLYAGDLGRFPDAVSLDDAWLDKSGYYALARPDAANHDHPKERQLDFFGGLRWRYEEHIPAPRRKIDRVAMFRARKDISLRDDHTFTDEELNTYTCPWHNNLTAAIASFRTAKALKRNPGSTFDIESFRWHNSTPFEWHSRQLLDLGLMEPGQWF
ncbi:hypothetical protein [Rhodalgimonas zhirmunskyi]|uniref:Uncharacterized protein n=1 Tax=Rhodalgimonas zhirmunskyi TaxID=2964767 RepID=A0AAJ1UDZ1_9RHOB|nr:hypothetical protein [Rhodoalgimonas zhirmunskyi]MDQ2094571.1 hypothetical protein [Rhodoalgimonas zhirmunskyi]